MNPIEQLLKDREQARANEDPCANLCTVASVDAHNLPQARTLVLRELGSRLALFLNQTSPKWQQITSTPVICVVVWLPSVNVQYRLQCRVEPVEKRLVDESWLLRPRIPKQLDWFYTTRQAQSTSVADRQSLVEAVTGLNDPEHEFAPRTARGWYLKPFHLDRLDLANPSGVHDRHGYALVAGVWQEAVLVP